MKIADLFWLPVIWLSAKRHIHGCDVYVEGKDRPSEELTKMIDEALGLIAGAHYPLYKKVQRYTPRIIVSFGGGAQFIRSLRACLVGDEEVRSRTTLELAMLFVHEATHGRIWARGISYSRSHRARIERLCVKAEVQLASKVPGGSEAAAAAVQALQTEWWSPELVRERGKKTIAQLGLPKWLLQLLLR